MKSVPSRGSVGSPLAQQDSLGRMSNAGCDRAQSDDPTLPRDGTDLIHAPRFQQGSVLGAAADALHLLHRLVDGEAGRFLY